MSTTLYMMAWDGVHAVNMDGVFVDAYNTEVNYAEDGITPLGQTITVTGTAVIPAGNEYQTFIASLRNGGNRLQAAQVFVGSVPLVNLQKVDDDQGGPFCKITTNEVVGFGCAFMRFELSAKQSYVVNQTVTSHNWTQTMQIDGNGLMTRTINGHLHVARNTKGTNKTLATYDSWKGKVAYADLFRRAITPDVPGEGWRRESQTFALDVSSTILTYTLVDKRYVSDLPDGVRVGDMDFTYERSADNQNLATVRFTCDLEGDIALSQITGTTGNRRLVEAAVALSKTRLNLDYQRALVQRMVVTERQLLSGFSIRFELDALMLPVSSQELGSTMVPLAYMIGNRFHVNRTVTRAVDAYGPIAFDKVVDKTTTYGMVPHFLDNAISGMELAPTGDETNPNPGFMPYATLFNIQNANVYGTVQVYVVSGADGTTAMNSSFSGKFSNQQTQPGKNDPGFLTIVNHSISITKAKYDSGIVRLMPMYVDAPDLVMQVRKPCVHVTERIEVSRLNQAPAKQVRPLPAYAYLVSDDWNVTFGKYDAQGNRMFTGVYERTYAVYDSGGPGQGFVTQTAPGGAVLRAWGAPQQTVLPTLSLLGYTETQQATSNVFAVADDMAAAYTVPTETYVT